MGTQSCLLGHCCGTTPAFTATGLSFIQRRAVGSGSWFASHRAASLDLHGEQRRCRRRGERYAVPLHAAGDRLTPFRSTRTDLSLYLIADVAYVSQLGSRQSLEELTERALASGCVRAVQLRDKRSSLRKTLELAKRLRAVCAAAGVPFLMNDRLDLALAVDADGLHVGQEDMPLEYVQKLVPADWIIGASAGSLSEVTALKQASTAERPIRLDYIGCGPVFGTQTKLDAGAPIGIRGLAHIVEAVAPLPVLAVGGIGISNARQCISQGKAAGIACISAILGAEDPRRAAEDLDAEIRRGRDLRVHPGF